MPALTADIALTEIRCPRCRGYSFSLPKGTVYEAKCHRCGLKYADRA